MQPFLEAVAMHGLGRALNALSMGHVLTEEETDSMISF